MKRIYKYRLKIVDQQTIEAPTLAEWLHVGMQGDELCVWGVVDPEEYANVYTFRIIGTGHPIPDAPELKHVGTVVGHLGSLVWHVFEKG